MSAYCLRIVRIECKFLRFASSDADRDDFRRMFSDSTIASKYSQEEAKYIIQTKTKYIIQFVLDHYISNELIADITGKSFSFKFDESTTQRVKGTI